jgi:hypothetical protein
MLIRRKISNGVSPLRVSFDVARSVTANRTAGPRVLIGCGRKDRPEFPGPVFPGKPMRGKMQDHSHKMLFLGASALMCAAAMFGSQAGPWLLVNEQGAPVQFASDTGLRSDADGGSVFLPVADVQNHRSTATIVPNGTSCPAGNAARLISPAGVPPTGTPTPQPPLQSGATLGTGSSCPPPRADGRTDVSQDISEATPKLLAGNNLPARPPRP